MTTGRCRPCHRHYVWPTAAARRGEMRCPRCQRPLTRAGQPVGDVLIALSATEARQAAESTAVPDRTTTGGGAISTILP